MDVSLIGLRFNQCVGSIELNLNLFTSSLYDVVLQLLVLQPAIAHQEDAEPPSVKELLMDPYIIVAAGKRRSCFC